VHTTRETVASLVAGGRSLVNHLQLREGAASVVRLVLLSVNIASRGLRQVRSDPSTPTSGLGTLRPPLSFSTLAPCHYTAPVSCRTCMYAAAVHEAVPQRTMNLTPAVCASTFRQRRGRCEKRTYVDVDVTSGPKCEVGLCVARSQVFGTKRPNTRLTALCNDHLARDKHRERLPSQPEFVLLLYSNCIHRLHTCVATGIPGRRRLHTVCASTASREVISLYPHTIIVHTVVTKCRQLQYSMINCTCHRMDSPTSPSFRSHHDRLHVSRCRALRKRLRVKG
jgi:hypothetical protein